MLIEILPKAIRRLPSSSQPVSGNPRETAEVVLQNSALKDQLSTDKVLDVLL
jgi:hypothetical protein